MSPVTQKMLKAIGLEYDKTEQVWEIPVPMPTEVQVAIEVERNGNWIGIREALNEVNEILGEAGVKYICANVYPPMLMQQIVTIHGLTW